MHKEFTKWVHHQRSCPSLYDYRFEHDACGVGMVCHLKGEKSHGIIADGLKILVNLTHRGQSLIVWAISEGREAARCIDVYLMGTSELPSKGGGDLPRS